MKFKKAIPYGIKIEPTINGGFIVHVGCSVTLAYGDLKQLRKASEEYFADPEKVHEEYSKARHDQAPTQAPQASTGGGEHTPYPSELGGARHPGLPVGSVSGRR